MSRPLLGVILENAVKIEEESYALYTTAQGKAELPSSKALLAELARAELSHKQKLLAIIEGKADVSQLGSPSGRIEDLKIADFVQDATLSENTDYPAILMYAAKREKNTYEHYRSLAAGPFAHYFPTAGEVFSKLAEEELIHKNRLEREYDEHVLKED